MPIDTKTIAQLREKTGAGVVDCKKALAETDGDIEKAIEHLRKTGAKKLQKKQDRATGEGLVSSYIHAGGRVGTMVLVRCETDFVSMNEDFKALGHDLAMHVAAASPRYLAPEDVPAAEFEKEKEIYAEQLKAEGKPADMIAKIVEGKAAKYYEEVCLLKQPFVKDDKKKIEDLIAEAVTKLGENIRIEKFERFSL